MEEIRKANRGCSAENLVFYFSENFPQNFTYGAFLLNELRKVQNLEHEMNQLWLRDNDGEKWLTHVQDIQLVLSEHAQKGSSAPLILLSHIVKRVSNYAPRGCGRKPGPN